MLVHSTVETVLAYLNCHTLYLSGGFIFVGRLLICLFTCSWQLVVILAITIITAYLITSNGCAPRYKIFGKYKFILI